MAAFLYEKTLDQLLAALLSGDVKVILLSTGTEPGDYAPSETGDEFLADIPAGGRVAISAVLTNKDVSGGWFSSDNVAFAGLTGEEIEAFAIFIDTGNEATSRLYYYCDTASGDPGLPLTPNGGNATLTCPANGWFHL